MRNYNQDSRIIKRALMFAENGYLVFPTYKSQTSEFAKPFGWSGTPPTDESKKSLAIYPTTNVSDLENWPKQISKYRAPMTGFGVLGAGIIILDIDNKNNKSGNASLRLLRKKFSIPEPVMVTKTKSGGFHLYYARPSKYKDVHIKSLANLTINGQEYTGIDIRGDGGCVIGPELIKSTWVSGKYVLIKGKPNDKLSVLPDDLCNYLATYKISKINNMNSANSKSDDLDTLIDKTNKYLNKAVSDESVNNMIDSSNEYGAEDMAKHGTMPNSVPKGQRNNTVFLYVSALKNKGYSKQDTKKLAEILINEKCEQSPDINEQIDLDDILNRAYNVNMENPFDIARYIMENDLYKIIMKGSLWYFTTSKHEFFPAAEFISSSGLRSILAPHSAKIQIGDDKPKNINPADIINQKYLGETFVAGTGFFGEDKKIVMYKGRTFVNIFNKPESSGLENRSVTLEFKKLIVRLFGSEDSDDYQLAMDFLAWTIQHPDKKCSIAPFLISKNRGVGKSLLFGLLQGILGHSKFGTPQAKIARIDNITNKFFDPTNCVINLFDEVQFEYHKNVKQESAEFWRNLKNYITAEELAIEEKFKPIITKPMTASFMLAGNSGTNFAMEDMDRRLWIVDNESEELPKGVCDTLFKAIKAKVGDPEYAEQIFKSLRIYLNRWKIKNDLTSLRAPDTAIKQEMVHDSKSDIELWFIEYFSNHNNLFAKRPFVTKNMIYYIIETSDMPERWKTEAYVIFKRLTRSKVIEPVRTKSDKSITMQLKNIEDVSTNGRIDKVASVLVYSHRRFDEFERDNARLYIQDHVDQLKDMRKTKLSLI